MFIGVSMQLQAVFKYFLSHTVGRLPLKKKKKKKKKVGALLRMRTSTNLRRRDAAKKINDIHGDFNDIHAFFFFFTRHPGHNFRWEIRET